MSHVAFAQSSAKSTLREVTFLTGSALAALLVAAGAILHDREPIGLAIVALLGLAATRFRGGRIGYALLALLSVDVAFFTVLETAGNLSQPTGPLALAIPTALAATAVVALVASMAALLGRPLADPVTQRLALGASLVVVAILAVGFVVGSSASRTGAIGGLVLHTQGQAFSQTRLTSPSDEVTVTISNGDLFYHTFTIDELGVNVYVPVGGSRTVTFKAPPGTYRYYCAIPGHAALGMEGTLVVR